MTVSRILFILLFAINSLVAAQTNLQRESTEHFNRGEEYFNNGDWELAILHFDSSTYIQPLLFDAYYSRAIAKERIGDIHGAIADYGIQIHLDPEFTESHWNRAVLYYEIEYYELAREDLNNLLELPEDETNSVYFQKRYPDTGVSRIATLETMKGQVYNYLGLIADKLNESTLAIAHFTTAINLDSSNTDVLVNRSLVYEKTGNYQAAINDLRLAQLADPGNILATYNIARIQESQGTSQDVIASYTTIIEESPEFAEAYAKRGIAKMNVGDYIGALSDYDSAIYFSRDDALLWLNKGIVQMKTRQYHKAYSAFSKAIELNPAFEDAYFNRGNAHLKLEEYSRAVRDYNKAILYDTAFAMAFYNRGIAYHRTQQIDRACIDIKKAMNLGIIEAKNTYIKMCR